MAEESTALAQAEGEELLSGDDRQAALDDLKGQLRELVTQINVNFEAIGEALVRNQGAIGLQGVHTLIRWCHSISGIAQCQFTVWYRVASGEIPKELVTDTRISNTTLAAISVESAQEMMQADKKYEITDLSQGKIMRKHVSEFTRAECREFVGPAGVREGGKAVEPRRYQRYRVDDVFRGDDGLVFRVDSFRGEFLCSEERVREVLA